MKDVTQTLLSQYADSPTMVGIIMSFNDAVDPAVDLAAFYANIWNVNTAVGYGLDVWGQIVGVNRVMQIQTTPLLFGFGEAFLPGDPTHGVQPFDQATFYSGEASTMAYTLPDDSYRLLILAKALANITNCTAAGVNKILQLLYASKGRAYVLDTGGMAFKVVFEFDPSDFDTSVIIYSGVFPRPAGVLVNLIHVDVNNVFGFSGTGLQPLNQGTFTPI